MPHNFDTTLPKVKYDIFISLSKWYNIHIVSVKNKKIDAPIRKMQGRRGRIASLKS